VWASSGDSATVGRWSDRGSYCWRALKTVEISTATRGMANGLFVVGGGEGGQSESLGSAGMGSAGAFLRVRRAFA
jgi:hypothetical protein